MRIACFACRSVGISLETLEGVRVTPPPLLAQEAASLRFSIGAAGLFAPPGESDELQVQPFPITEASRKLL